MRSLLRLLPFPLREKERYFNLAPWEQVRAYFSLSLPYPLADTALNDGKLGKARLLGEGWGEGVFRARGCSL
jgi:hypothetical protein